MITHGNYYKEEYYDMAKPKPLLQRLANTIKTSYLKALTWAGHRPIWQIDEGHVIEPAFISQGIQYYRLKDYFNTFSLRGLAALQVYEEWNMRISKDDLKQFIEKSEKVLGNPKQINIGEIARIVSMLKERLDFVVPTSDLVYKFASVAFFDRNESPYNYDPEYCKEKIARWKEAADIDDFFIVLHLKDILPLPTLSEDDLRVCLTIVDQVAGAQLAKVQE